MGTTAHRPQPATQQRIVSQFAFAPLTERPPRRDERPIGSTSAGRNAARQAFEHGIQVFAVIDDGDGPATAVPHLVRSKRGDR